MRATEELRADHGLLRAKLTLLERLLPLAPAARPTLLEHASRLARALRCHTEKEELLLSILNDRLPAELSDMVPDLLDAHERHSRGMLSVLRLLAARADAPIEEIANALSRLVVELREHLAREEDRLFQELDRLLVDAQASEATRLMREVSRAETIERAGATRGQARPIAEETTIGRILRVHPEAEPVLAAFQIDAARDEAKRLDELLCERGIDIDALILALNQSLDEPNGLPVPSVLWESCDGMMVIDAERRILAMNPAMQQLTGRRIKDLAGRQMCGALLDCQDLHGCPLANHPEA